MITAVQTAPNKMVQPTAFTMLPCYLPTRPLQSPTLNMSNDVRALLFKLRQSAQFTLDSLALPPIVPKECPPIPVLQLPPPEHIRSSLRELELPEPVTVALCNAFDSAVSKLRYQCLQQYERAAKTLLTVNKQSNPQEAFRLVDKMAATFCHIYANTYVPKIKSDVLRQATTWCHAHRAEARRAKGKAPFNFVGIRIALS